MICIRTFLITTIALTLITGASLKSSLSNELSVSPIEATVLSSEERQQRLLQTTLSGVGLVTLWGLLEWDYFSQTPHAQSEGWLGEETKSGTFLRYIQLPYTSVTVEKNMD